MSRSVRGKDVLVASGVTTTRLVLIRHGESRSNAEGWISGNATCGGLTELGRQQADALRARLADDESRVPDAVVVSTMARAIQTAEIVAGSIAVANGFVIERIDDLSERRPGEAEGMNHEQYRATYGRGPYEDWVAPMSPGGESHDEFIERIEQTVMALAEKHRGRTVWVVCHGGIIVGTSDLLIRGIDERVECDLHNPANASITEWHATHRNGTTEWSLAVYDDHAHLSDA